MFFVYISSNSAFLNEKNIDEEKKYYTYETERISYVGEIDLKESSNLDALLGKLAELTTNIDSETRLNIKLDVVDKIDQQALYKLAIDEKNEYDAIEIISTRNTYLYGFDKEKNIISLYLITTVDIYKDTRYDLLGFMLYRFCDGIIHDRVVGVMGSGDTAYVDLRSDPLSEELKPYIYDMASYKENGQIPKTIIW